MNKFIYIFATVALISTAMMLFHHKNNTQKLEGISSEWNNFKILYSKNYESQEVEIYRYAIFIQNYVMIKTHDPRTGYTMAINQFADLTNEEFRSTYLGYKSVPREKNYQGLEKLSANPPSSVNWVTAGDVSAVKNQGQCGSCWAFSTTGSLESCDAIFGTGLGDFSEQQLVDCSTSYGNNGCNGGLMDYAFNYVIANGITTEQAYPYTGVQGTCKINGGAFKITSYTDVPANNCNMLQAAVAQQPTSVAVDAQTWQFYSSGIFSFCGESVDHGVLAAGYTPTYWLVKNSWGASWGMQGYIQLKMGNTCAICSEASYPNLN